MSLTTLQLALSSGTTVDLMSGATDDYQLVESGYAPKIPRRSISPLGPLGGYEEVEESITVDIYGTTAADCYANLATLADLIDHAIGWYDTTPIDYAAPERLELVVQPQGSALAAPLRAVITGATAMPELQPTWNDRLMIYTIEGVTITFTRRALVGATESVTGGNPLANTVQTITFAGGSKTQFCPVRFDLAATASSGTRSTFPPSFLCFASSTYGTGIRKLEADVFTGGSPPWTTLTDSPNWASGTAAIIMRYTPTTTAATVAPVPDNSLITRASQQLAVLMKVRSSSATPVWTIELVGYDAAILTPISLATADPVSGSTAAQVISFGEVTIPPSIAWLSIRITVSTISGSPYLDIDTLLAVDMNEPSNVVIPVSQTNIASTNASAYTNGDWWKATDAPIWAHNASTSYNLLNAAAPADLAMRGAGVQCCWYCVDSTTSTRWAPVSDSFNNIISAQWTFTRAPAYLTPE